MLNLILSSEEGPEENLKFKGSLGYSDHEEVEFEILGQGGGHTANSLPGTSGQKALVSSGISLPGRVMWKKALKGRAAKEIWVIFKDYLLQAKKQ